MSDSNDFGPCIGFGELLEHLDSVFGKIILWSGGEGKAVERFSKSHVFFVGDEEKVENEIEEIWKDLKEDVRERILMPFKDVTVIAKRQKFFEVGECWNVFRLIEDPALGKEGQPFSVFSYTVKNSRIRIPPRLWSFWYHGSRPVSIGEQFRADMSDVIMIDLDQADYEPVTDRGVKDECFGNTGQLLRIVAAISHPENYVVKVTPRLTPREERRALENRPNPAKKPHFIVIDHEVLVGMSGRKSDGSHASPIPHHRRGHWRRLAERCRNARLLHGDRIPVRPTYIGNREFSDERNLYEVLLEFGAKKVSQ
jgi:hypothetical protein